MLKEYLSGGLSDNLGHGLLNRKFNLEWKIGIAVWYFCSLFGNFFLSQFWNLIQGVKPIFGVFRNPCSFHHLDL